MVVIDSDNENDDDETLAGFMPSHINSEKNSFQDSLASLM